MKKLLSIIPVIAMSVLLLTFVRCEKDTTCKLRVKCYFSKTGIDTGAAAAGCHVNIGKTEFAAYAQDSGYCDAMGIFETSFPLEAVLGIEAQLETTDVDNNVVFYAGKGEATLIPGETVEKVILLVPQQE
ncbi:MAG: hypothetical protein LBR51_05210 [Bacteroidales bacterium]|jgi:hypothetical protein|nr:hypothetical protein [Bacteroidales bacterium]